MTNILGLSFLCFCCTNIYKKAEKRMLMSGIKKAEPRWWGGGYVECISTGVISADLLQPCVYPREHLEQSYF